MAVTNWNLRNSYFLGLMSFGYVIGEIAHFLIITTQRSVARDVHYGDMGCYGNATFPKEHRNTNLTCEGFKNESTCIAVIYILLFIYSWTDEETIIINMYKMSNVFIQI